MGNQQLTPFHDGRCRWFVQRQGSKWQITVLSTSLDDDETIRVVLYVDLPPSSWIRECATARAGVLVRQGRWKCQCDRDAMSIEGPTSHLTMSPESWLLVADRIEGRDGGVI